MEKKSRSWSIAMTYNLSYIAFRMKIPAPLPHMLYCRVKAVFFFFNDKKYMNTRSPLFNDKDGKNQIVCKRQFSGGGYFDPPGPFCGFLFQKTDVHGQCMMDKDGLWIYLYMRGTSLLELMHQNITKLFGHTMSGVLYSNCLMTLL